MPYRLRVRVRRSSFRAIATGLLLSTALVAPAWAVDVHDSTELDAAITAANSGGDSTINLVSAVSYSQTVSATFTGQINVAASGATLNATATNQYNNNLVMTVNSGATFATGGFTQNLGNFGGSGTLDADGGSNFLTFGADNGNSTFDGTILKTIQDGAAAKVGTGTLTINNLNMAQGEFYGVGGTIAVNGAATTANLKYLALGTSPTGNAVMNVSDGTLNITGTFSGGPPCGSNCPALQVGDFGGVGVFNQTGGVVQVGAGGVASSLNIGNQGGNGTYNLSGGSLILGVLGDPNSAGSYSIGRQATTNVAFANSTGLLNLSGTGLLDLQAGFFVIGDRDGGGAAGAVTSSTLTQTGGTFRVNAGTQLYLAGADNGNAIDSTYNLNGGTLEVGGNSLQAHYAPAGTTATYAFNLGGGTIKVIGSALTTASDVNATLTTSTQSTIDTNGFGATWNGVFSGGGGLDKTGLGTLTLNGLNTYTGATNVQQGTLLAGISNALSTSTAVTLDPGTTLDLTNTSQSIGSLAGSGTVQLGNTGFLTTGNDNSNTSFSGTVIQNAPQTAALAKVGSGTWDISGMTMAEGEFYVVDGTLAQSSASTSIKYLAVGEGAGSADMTVSGGTLNITGNYPGSPAICGSNCPSLQIGDFGGTGVLTQTAGVVQIGAPGVGASLNIGNQGGNGTYDISGGSLILGVTGDANSAGLYDIGRSTSGSRNSVGELDISATALVDLQAGAFINGDRDSSGAGATTSSTINQTGGTFQVGAGSTLFLAGADNANAVDSIYNLTGGTLKVGGTGLQAHYSPAGTTAGYQFNIGAATIQVIGSALTTDANATLNSGTQATIDTNGFGATWNGLLSGSGGLIKAGAGTLTLDSANTYTGATHVTGGTLAAGVSAALSTSTAVTVDGGTTLDFTNTTQSIGSLAGSGTVQLGSTGFFFTGNDNTNTSFSGTILQNAPQTGAVGKVGSGTWNISGMTMAEGEFYVIDGALAQSSGSTHIKYLAVGEGTGDVGNMSVTGGTLNITGNYPGSPAICGSNCPALQIGDFGGTGVLTQTAGTVAIGAPGVGASMNIGNQGGNGTYDISGGTLQLGVLGDVNSAGLYSLGRSTTAARNSVGELDISGTALVDVQAGELINGMRDSGGTGAATSATIDQTGGTLRVQNGADLWLSGFNGSNAIDSVYNLSGGTLEIGGNRLQAGYGGGTGAYEFNMGTATIKVIDADLTTSVHGTLTGATLATGTTLNTNSFNATWSGVLDGAGWLIKTGAGTLRLDGVNTYSGGTAFNGGTVFVDAATDLGATTAAMSFNGGTLQLGANDVLMTRTGGTNMAGAGTIDTNGFDTTYDGSITGSGALTKVGLGILDLGGSNNAHTGAVNVNAGQLNAFGGNAIGDTSAVTVASGAAFRIYGASPETIGSLAGAGSLLLGPNVLITGGNNTSTTWTGTTDAGTGGITKVGSGTMTVNANLSYTGVTNVNGGTFVLNGSAADSVVVNSGATLGGNSTIGGNLTLNAGGHLAPGNSPGTTHVLGNYSGGGVLDAQVQFNNAGAPVPGTGGTNDFLWIDHNVSNTTLINVIAIAPSNAPAATTGNGIELVQVDGTVTANQFALAGPVFQGGYEYVLNYMQDFAGSHDGFFLQSVARDELWGQVAALTAGQAMTDRCFRGGDRTSNGEGEDKRGRVWASAVSGSLSTGANTGIDTDQDYTCGVGGIDMMAGENLRVGLQGGYGNSSVDVQTPGGVGKLDGNESVIEAYAVYAKEHVFLNVSAGYATTDWTFDAPISGQSSATIDGLIASAQGGMRWPMGNVRLGVLAQIDYDGTTCGSDCFVAGTSEQTSQWLAKGSLRVDGRYSDGSILPYVALSIMDNLDGANRVALTGATVESDPGLLFGAEAGLTALVAKNVALFADVGVTSGLDKDVNGFDGQGGVKLYW